MLFCLSDIVRVDRHPDGRLILVDFFAISLRNLEQSFPSLSPERSSLVRLFVLIVELQIQEAVRAPSLMRKASFRRDSHGQRRSHFLVELRTVLADLLEELFLALPHVFLDQSLGVRVHDQF